MLLKWQDKNSFSVDSVWRRQNIWEKNLNWLYRLSFNKERKFWEAKIQLPTLKKKKKSSQPISICQPRRGKKGGIQGDYSKG